MILRTAALAAMLCAPLAAGATEVPPVIEQDTTWTAAGSPYTVANTTSVAEGVTLTLEPGVTVELAEGVDLFVFGEILAMGTESETVLFTGAPTDAEPERWGSVVFEESSAPAVYADVDDYQSGCMLEHCVFEYATRALRMGGASPYVHRCEFRHNLVEDSTDSTGGAAMVIRQGSTPRIRECHFHDNETTDPYVGGALYIHDAGPVIQDCVFEDNDSAYGGAISAELMYTPMVGNHFERNVSASEGGAVSLVSCSLGFYGNEVADNTSWWGDGGGVHVCVTCSPHSAPMMMDNTITGNVAQYHGAGGVGAAYMRVFSYNDVHHNLLVDEPADFAWHNAHTEDPEWVRNPSIPNNWWGISDSAAIDEFIFDGNDDDAYGTVDYEPIADGPIAGHETRVGITTRRIAYDAPTETMPTFLTLYNPGPAREVELLILLQVDELPPVVYGGDVDFPGAEQGTAGARLALPENTVFSTELLAPEYQVPEAFTYGQWHAAIFDASSLERIGDVSSARFDFSERGGES
jgi:hypothetical protein